MKKHIVKVDKSNRGFRLYIPRKIILKKRWGGVSHVLIEESQGDNLLIRRLVDEKALDK